jgi:hypothetical protein
VVALCLLVSKYLPRVIAVLGPRKLKDFSVIDESIASHLRVAFLLAIWIIDLC